MSGWWRLCVAEIEGRRGLPASCTTPVASGMAARTQSSKVMKVRRGVMALYGKRCVDPTLIS